MNKRVSIGIMSIVLLGLVGCATDYYVDLDLVPDDVVVDDVVTGGDVVVEDSSTGGVEIVLDDLVYSIEGKVELPMLGDVDDATLLSLFGVNASDFEEYKIRIPMMSVTASEYGIFKGDREVIDAVISKRIEDLQAMWKSYLPEQYDLVNKYSVYSNGDYVMYAIMPEVDKVYVENIFNNAFDSSIELLEKPVEFKKANGEVLSVSDEGIEVLVEGEYILTCNYTTSTFIDLDMESGETYVPLVGDYVFVEFSDVIVYSDTQTGDITFMGRSYQVDDFAGVGSMEDDYVMPMPEDVQADMDAGILMN